MKLLLFGDYSSGVSPEEEFEKLEKSLYGEGIETVYFDQCPSSFCMIKEIDAIAKSKEETMILSSGLGILPAILAASILPAPPKKLIIVGPVFGKGSVKWKWHEKLVNCFSNYKFLENEKFWEEQFFYLSLLMKKGVEIIFLLSPNDGRIEYSDKVIRTMEKLNKKDNVFYFDVGGGWNTIRHPENLPMIIEKLLA